ncbi:MAG TPA: YfhO family protein [Solirubrobacteraceae bacterium]|nr:YfhO family protein [Solirubrobacteraceae bacterium]
MPVVVFLAMIAILLGPSLLGGKILSSGDVVFFQGPFNGEKPATLTRMGNSELFDPVLAFQPDLITIRRAVEKGELGLWTPDQAGGRPLWASQQTGTLFPLTWLAFVQSFWRALAWIAAFKLLLAGLGAYVLGRWTGLRRGPALLVGATYAFCSYMNDELQFPLSGVMAMTPWALLTAGRVARDGRPLDVLGLVVTVGLTLLTGSPELIAIALGGVVVYALYELFAGPRTPGGGLRSSRGRRLALLATGAVGGLALSGAALGPFIEFLGLANTTSRGGAGIYPNSIAYSFFFPELWGRPDKAMGQFGPINYTERTAYIGALPVLLAVGGVFARRPRGAHLFWALFAAGAVLIAMHTFVHDFVAGLPGPDHVNMLRTLLLVSLAGAMLAGLGLQVWLDANDHQRRRMIVAMIAAALLPAAFLLRDTNPFSHFFGALGQLPSLGREAVAEKSFIKQIVAWRWIVFGSVGLGLLALVGHVPRRLVLALVIALVAGDLLTMDAGYNPQIPRAEASPTAPPALGYVQTHIRHQRVSGTLTSTGVDLQANLAERYALRDVGSYDFPKTSRWAQLWGAYGQSTGDQNDWNPDLPKSHAVLDAFAVSLALPPAGTRGPAWLKPVYDQTQGAQLVLENKTALPRAWVAYDWRTVSSRDTAASLTVASSTDQLHSQPILEGAPQSPHLTRPPRPGVASFVADRDEYVSLRADVRRSGYLILDDSYYPGWQASVDGHRAKIVAANENFRAVAVTPGVHMIDFSYKPSSFRVGSIVSIVTAAALLLGLAMILGSRRRRAVVG